jgi:hypothetical protein
VLYEVYKHSKRLRGEEGGLDASAVMAKTLRSCWPRRGFMT